MVALLVASLALAQAPPRVTLLFGGDVIPHTPLREAAARHGWAPVFAPLADTFAAADFTVLNLEAPVVSLKKPEQETLVFWAPPELPRALARAGVDVLGFANNHSLDQHREGIASTRAFLADAGVRAVGADVDEAGAWSALELEKDGLRVGVLAFTRFLNGFNNRPDAGLPHVPAVPYPESPIGGGRTEAATVDLVRALAPRFDALILFVHWGQEYAHAPLPRDRAFAQALLDAGAFAIIGAHPHVLQPVEALPRADGGVGLVAFSLGNLLSNQDAADERGVRRDGLLLRLELVRREAGVTLEGVTPLPVTVEHLKARRARVVLVAQQLAEAEVGLAAPGLPKVERRRLERQREVALQRQARVERFFQDAALRRAWPGVGGAVGPEAR